MEKEKFEMDYKDKANSFSNWLTSLIISTLVYLIHLRDSDSYSSLLKDYRLVFILSLILLLGAIIMIFLFRLIGVVTSRKRYDKGIEAEKDCSIKYLEWFREKLFLTAIILSGFGMIPSAFILWMHLFKYA